MEVDKYVGRLASWAVDGDIGAVVLIGRKPIITADWQHILKTCDRSRPEAFLQETPRTPHEIT